MRITKSIVLLLACAFFSFPVLAQKYAVPENYGFNKQADYKKYAPDVVKCAAWLEKNTMEDENPKYNETVNFISEWATGCDLVDFNRSVRIESAFSECSKLGIYVTAGWAKNAIESDYKATKLDNYVAGIQFALQAYKKNKNLHCGESIRELIKMDNRGKLRQWVDEQMQ